VRKSTFDHAAGVRLPDDVKAWPGVGPKTAAKLRIDGVSDFIHLLAKYVTTYKKDDEQMYNYLQSKGIHGQHCHTIVIALKARVTETIRRDQLHRQDDPRLTDHMRVLAARGEHPSLRSQWDELHGTGPAASAVTQRCVANKGANYTSNDSLLIHTQQSDTSLI
jgi:hypothetical protein